MTILDILQQNPVISESFVNTLLAVSGAVATGLTTAIGFLWRRVEALDLAHDQLLVKNAELQSKVATLQSDLDVERARNVELSNQVAVLTESRDRERTDKTKLQKQLDRITDELTIYRKAFKQQGVDIPQPTRRQSDGINATSDGTPV